MLNNHLRINLYSKQNYIKKKKIRENVSFSIASLRVLSEKLSL